MDKAQQMEVSEEFFDRFDQLHDEYTQFWLDHIFLHWEWWISVILTIGPWVFWFFYRKKESTHRLLYAGFFSIILALSMDYLGTSLGLWHYTGKTFPSFPAWSPYHMSLVPVTIMFLIQAKPHIAPWKKGVFYGLLTAFVGEPIFVWAGFYVMTEWTYIYSVPIYALIFVICDRLANSKSFEHLSGR
ncbi:CBO0543 family protein [Lentibacillus sediminis]|uniref:CBO0543 family protein n=1 Tax=Lentibacillus sediminis TaxID=1940529 RepID=UPI000C1C5340|nr:CBO0543 family protein [Lentibacillus sediminis]